MSSAKFAEREARRELAMLEENASKARVTFGY
jgi:hypothetical protein